MRAGRLPWLDPSELDVPQHALYESIMTSRRAAVTGRPPLTDEAGRLHGPFNALLFNPSLGQALQQLGSEVRFHTAPSPRARELAILEVAVAEHSSYEWLVHELAGRDAGLSAEEIAAIRSGAPAPTLSPEEAGARAVVQTLVRGGDLSQQQFEAASEALGLAYVLDLVVLVGYYRLLALLMRSARTPVPAGYASEFADVDDEPPTPALT